MDCYPLFKEKIANLKKVILSVQGKCGEEHLASLIGLAVLKIVNHTEKRVDALTDVNTEVMVFEINLLLSAIAEGLAMITEVIDE